MREFLGLLICCASIAAGPTTRPRDIAPADAPASPVVGQVVDATRPVHVPQFISVANTPPLQAERDWAYQNTYPLQPWVGYHPFGHGRGTPFHGFYR
jgi:hypothetical protein